jgi:DNA-binding transcriptional ArsR family regulator
MSTIALRDLVTSSKSGQADNLQVDYSAIKKAALTFRAVNHHLRQNIIKLLDERKKMAVTEIYVQLRLEQSVASQHLGILRRAGIVKTQRDGKFIYYSLDYTRLYELSKLAREISR